jgi:FAD:protein FMN transferase
MGTRFEVFLRGEDAEHLEAVAAAVCEEVARLDSVLSRFDPRSEVARVNREAALRAVRVDRELFALLARCDRARDLTEGYFDVTRGGGLSLDAERCAVRLARADDQPGGSIDLGAVGKGYALDCGREILSRYGVRSALLQGGTSSVLALGGEAWPVELRHPLRPDLIVGRVELRARSLSCSAVRHAGEGRSDVRNPLTREPLDGDAACVVLAADATDAEFYSTALLAMGRRRAARYLGERPALGVAAGWIEDEFVWLRREGGGWVSRAGHS